MTPTLFITKLVLQNFNKIYIKASNTYSFYFTYFKDLLSFCLILFKSCLIPYKYIIINNVTIY
jgi:hypothetical protein